MKNKILLVALSMTTMLSISTMLAGCGESADSSTSSATTVESTTSNEQTSDTTTIVDENNPTDANFVIPEGGYDGSEVTVNFYHTMGDSLQADLNVYVEEFNKLYPNITIAHDQVGGYDDVRDQIKTELSVGDGPSMAYCYPDHVALYNKTKRVVQLDNLINDTTTDGEGNLLYGMTKAQQDDFIQGYLQEGYSYGDGHLYTLPFSKSTEVLYYNEDFFTTNNINVPTHWFNETSTDTSSMEYVLNQIKTIDPASIPLGYDSEANWFITMCEQLGSPYTSANAETTADHFLFNNDTNKSFIETFKSWYEKGWITTQSIYGSYTSGLFVSTEAQKSYMSIGSSAGATHQRPAAGSNGEYPWSVGIASIPQDDVDSPKVISQGPSICIFNKGDDQEVMASWLFTRFLTTSIDFQAQFSMTSGYVPVLKSVGENEIYAAFMNSADGKGKISALAAKVCLEQEEAYYTSPAFIGSSEARDQVGQLLVASLTGTKTVAQAFEEAITACIENS